VIWVVPGGGSVGLSVVSVLSCVRLPEHARWGARRHGKDACVVRSGSAVVDVTAGFGTHSIPFRLGRSAAEGWLGPTQGGGFIAPRTQ